MILWQGVLTGRVACDNSDRVVIGSDFNQKSIVNAIFVLDMMKKWIFGLYYSF